MRILFAGIILFLAVGAVASQSQLTKEEYEIYGLVLTDFFRDSNRTNPDHPETHFLIASSTATVDPFTPESTSLDRSFNERNKERVNLERRFPVAFSYSIVDEQEILSWAAQDEAEFQAEQEQRRRDGLPRAAGPCGAEWNRLYARFPKSHGYYKLSRIGFSRNHRKAYLRINGKGSTWEKNSRYEVRWTKRGWKTQQVSSGFGVC